MFKKLTITMLTFSMLNLSLMISSTMISANDIYNIIEEEIKYNNNDNQYQEEEKKSFVIRDIHKEVALKYNINYKILKGITRVESNFKNLAINVNRNKKHKNLQGSHYFNNKKEAIDFANKIDSLGLNFDMGYNQINNNWKNIHFKKYDELFDTTNNITISAKILSYNLKRYCNNDMICRLSVYNTGYKKSSIGKKYANKVIKYSKKY